MAPIGLIESALHAPFAGFGDEDFYPDLATKAAVLCSRLVRNHPLVDGNKRAAFASMAVFLDANGYDLATDAQEADTVVRALAGREMTESAFVEWVKTKMTPRT